MRPRCWHRRLTTRMCLACSAFFFCLIAGSCVCGGVWQSSDQYLAIRPGEIALEWGPIYVSGPPPDTEVGCIPRVWIPGIVRYEDICTAAATPVGKFFSLSVWSPFLFVFLLAAILIAYDLRPPAPGKCACGYDLTGNTSGICPECGSAVLDRRVESAVSIPPDGQTK